MSNFTNPVLLWLELGMAVLAMFLGPTVTVLEMYRTENYEAVRLAANDIADEMATRGYISKNMLKGTENLLQMLGAYELSIEYTYLIYEPVYDRDTFSGRTIRYERLVPWKEIERLVFLHESFEFEPDSMIEVVITETSTKKAVCRSVRSVIGLETGEQR